MPSVRKARRPGRGRGTRPPRFVSERELVFVARREAELRVRSRGVTAAPRADAKGLERVLRKYGATARPLFGLSETRARHRVAEARRSGAAGVPDISVYYRVDAPDARLDEVANDLRRLEVVETAYVKPPAEPPVRSESAPAVTDAPPVTADFVSRQEYLEKAPGGVDARFAWTLGGGRGADVRIIDIEGAWRFSHEDLTQNQGGVVGGTSSDSLGWRNHGTAVIGEFGGDLNGLGVTGICPEANVSAISIFGGLGSAAAIRTAADRLRPGDVLLIELHRAGPRHDFEPRDDQGGYIAVEWWPDDFDAIRFATAKGVVVVEAAGNGGEDLDDPIYDNPQVGFPAGWTNPFNRANRDCGAIVVGAGAPPPGTHGRDHGPDRSRLDFSNFGACLDVQAWGREVTTCAYGDLQGGEDEDLWYTDRFSGTSSASPIVVGVAGCVQGHLRALGAAPLTPARMRECLRNTGSAQQDAPTRPASERIGNRPNLREAIAFAVGMEVGPSGGAPRARGRAPRRGGVGRVGAGRTAGKSRAGKRGAGKRGASKKGAGKKRKAAARKAATAKR
jgi:hypothetical protein